MKRVTLVLLLSAFAASPVYAQTCKPVSSEGKPLAGAAKASFMKKCCEDNAKSKEGKPLAGAAKTSFVKKCMEG